MEILPVRRALLSVTDKSGLEEFASFLQNMGVELISTGGTRKALLQAGLKVRSVSDVTGFPEILGGRVKTLHPHVHAGILANKEDASHMRTLKDLRLSTFDLVCVNLYNFAEAARQSLADKQAVEQIDIGGPCMLRAAAKNFHSVAVLPEMAMYGECMTEMREHQGGISLGFRRRMATKAFALTAAYDGMIATYLEQGKAPVS